MYRIYQLSLNIISFVSPALLCSILFSILIHGNISVFNHNILYYSNFCNKLLQNLFKSKMYFFYFFFSNKTYKKTTILRSKNDEFEISVIQEKLTGYIIFLLIYSLRFLFFWQLYEAAAFNLCYWIEFYKY